MYVEGLIAGLQPLDDTLDCTQHQKIERPLPLTYLSAGFHVPSWRWNLTCNRICDYEGLTHRWWLLPYACSWSNLLQSTLYNCTILHPTNVERNKECMRRELILLRVKWNTICIRNIFLLRIFIPFPLLI